MADRERAPEPDAGVDVAEFAGTWSNYRFPRSGTTVVSAIENQVSGLFVLKPQLGGKSRP